MAGAVAHTRAIANEVEIVDGFGIHHQPEALASDPDGAFVTAGAFVGEVAHLRDVASAHVGTVECAIHACRSASRNRKPDREGLLRWREQFADGTRRGQRIRFRHMKRESIRQESAGVNQRDRPIAQCIGIEVAADKPIRPIVQRVEVKWSDSSKYRFWA